jgi:hypothetical protein
MTLVIAGEEQNIALKPVGLMAVERRWGGSAFEEHPVEAAMYAAWVTVGKPGGVDGFEAWADSVDELVPPAAGDPTSATPSPVSLPSPSQPD